MNAGVRYGHIPPKRNKYVVQLWSSFNSNPRKDIQKSCYVKDAHWSCLNPSLMANKYLGQNQINWLLEFRDARNWICWNLDQKSNYWKNTRHSHTYQPKFLFSQFTFPSPRSVTFNSICPSFLPHVIPPIIYHLPFNLSLLVLDTVLAIFPLSVKSKPEMSTVSLPLQILIYTSSSSR